MRNAILLLAVSAAIISMSTGVARAAKSSYSGLVVSPAIEQLALTKDQTSASFTATVTNDSQAAVTISVLTDDFTALNSSGSISFLNNATHSPSIHGLAHWAMPALKQFVLKQGSTQLVPITIADASSLAPGGHYGAIIFKAVPLAATTEDNFVTANAEVSVLVFLTTFNPGSQSVKLLKPTLSSITIAMPSVADLVFANIGDIQTTPRGLVTITDSANREVARGIINTDSGLVLPSTNRLYQVELRSEKRFAWPGVYQMLIQYRAGDEMKIHSLTKSFLYISPPVVAVLIAAIVLSLLALIGRFGPRFVHYVSDV